MTMKPLRGFSYGVYFLCKGTLLAWYYRRLDEWGLLAAGSYFKFLSFSVLTPLVKYFHFQRLGKDKLYLKVSVITELLTSTLYFFIIYEKCKQSAFIAFVPALVSILLVTEVIQQKFLLPDMPYLGSIKLESIYKLSPWDMSFPFVVAIPLILISSSLDFDHDKTTWTFLLFVLVVLVFDIIFGFLHYMLHTVPSLKQMHALHHTFKKEELNALANFCVSFWDGVCMTAPLFPVCLAIWVLGHEHIVLIELLHSLACTHLRFREGQMNLVYFFEWDLLDMIFGQERISCFHAMHHNESNTRFAVFGFTPDSFFRSLLPTLATNKPKSHETKS